MKRFPQPIRGASPHFDREISPMNERERSEQDVQEGYVVDLACVRKYPRDELLERARQHSRECALMGHCIESGYGLIGDDGRLALLDAKATPKVVNAIEKSGRDRGIKLRATREPQDEEMGTVRVEEI